MVLKMKRFVIGVNDANQRLDKFVQKSVKSLPLSLVYKYIRLKRVKVNGKRGTISQRLAEGDVVELYINDEFFGETQFGFLAAPAHVDAVYEDENILLVDKKPGLVVHEDESGGSDTLIGRILHYLYDKGEYDPKAENSFAPALCNRIDRNTGGLVLATKNAEALRILNEKIKAREVEKHYLCICHGRFEEKSATLTAFLDRDEQEKRVFIHDRRQPGDLEIKTRYTVLAERGALSLVEVELLTGRTHQIRAHLAYLGHPLLGDGKYGSNALNRPYGMKAQALYAYRLAFRFKTDAGVLQYLDGKQFELKNIWFEQAFFSGGFDRPESRPPRS